ncbi:MAG: guanosine-3',5'-bis(diphosphate) 3'-pyrophosphohydrolase [Luteibaculaceae bacterium]|jgi:guanosine-3',5'-bis(diphosphate) 3'-pyrophosphohydrolase
MEIDLEKEKKEIAGAYRGLLRSAKRASSKEDKKLIRKAFDVAVEAHKHMRRKSGEPYIFHPIAVARICAEEMGLGALSIACGLLHDTVEDTDITLEDINILFGEKAERIIDGLTKISGYFDKGSSIQAENFRKMVLTLSEDVRVILIKLADRLHNMRTLESMRRDKQLKIASETLFLYAPLAHRLGLYTVKTELEDLALKYTEPEMYLEISKKLQKTKAVRTRFINQFKLPIERELDKHGLTYEVKARTKSIYSIYNKISKKNIPFEEIYDLFAMRIIIDNAQDDEKLECWKAYSLVTDLYRPNPDRLRDWLSNPKQNGYESLHTTVMSPSGKWVEVQIRSKRMDEIAEKGYAAHFRYKEGEAPQEVNSLDSWLGRIRDSLESMEANALDFIDDFKLNLFSEEIFVFTPKGEMRIMPSPSTALDFAFEIHTQVGASCIGAKVNQKLVPLSHTLRSGDQVEILTSKNQRPKTDWLDFVVTARAKSKIKSSLKDEKKRVAADGKEILFRKLNHLKIDTINTNIASLMNVYGVMDSLELYYRAGIEKLDLKRLKKLEVEGGRIILDEKKNVPSSGKKKDFFQEIVSKNGSTKGLKLVLGEDQQNLDYTMAQCCSPIAGDDVFGFITINDGIKIHRTNCPNSVNMLSKYAYRVVKAQWSSGEVLEFQAGIHFTGIDDMGLVNNITAMISREQKVNMRSISFESHDGIFEGEVKVFVNDTIHLEKLIRNLGKVPGVKTVERIQNS